MFGSKREKQQEIRIARLEHRLMYLEERVANLEVRNIPVGEKPKRLPRKPKA